MKHALAIPTTNRRALLEANVALLAEQSLAPDAIFVCVPNDAPPGTHAPVNWQTPIETLTAPRGLTRQRNVVLERALADGYDILTFIDDDFLPARNYVETVRHAFTQNPDYAVVMGDVPFDGVHNTGFTLEQGLRLLAKAEANAASQTAIQPHPGAYGCNMSIRLSAVGTRRFDERLPLYGWQEDIDFTSQLRNAGRIVGLSWLVGVHLGNTGGRSSGLRLGYSQITNPLYLMGKGTMPRRFGLALMARNLTANIARSPYPESHIDRRGRLQGNLLALAHALSGRIEPEHILNL